VIGRWNSLSQTALKLTAPGVPDIYQGTELWDLSLVDPDNRRPVDYEGRRSALKELRKQAERRRANLIELADELMANAADGRIKLYLIYRTLNYRREHPALFAQGGYVALDAYGERRDHVCAFARGLGDETMLVVVPRLLAKLTEGGTHPPVGPEAWGDAWLALPRGHQGGVYRNLLTDERLTVASHDDEAAGLELSAILRHFPVAILERVAD
jgi:(1->4)-alpha-D-glucan 1-alpha-D-glucosylmutase